MKTFIKNNEEFTCLNCGKLVPKHPTSSRDHCPYCLWGQHVDINPGDRLNDCRGMLKPVGIKIANGKTRVVYTCEKCKKNVLCIKAPDDNQEEILKLSSKKYEL